MNPEIRLLIKKYSVEITRLNQEMKNIPATIPWGVKSGKAEAYENIIKDLQNLI